jgi:hypothetical protein
MGHGASTARSMIALPCAFQAIGQGRILCYLFPSVHLCFRTRPQPGFHGGVAARQWPCCIPWRIVLLVGDCLPDNGQVLGRRGIATVYIESRYGRRGQVKMAGR